MASEKKKEKKHASPSEDPTATLCSSPSRSLARSKYNDIQSSVIQARKKSDSKNVETQMARLEK
jgi:hypothetical protein